MISIMKILVCIKQINDNGDMNKFDEFTLEEALKIKEEAGKKSMGPVSVDVVSAGTPKAFKVIRRAFGMGADRGIHVVMSKEKEKSRYIPPLTIASLLAGVASKTYYDLILTGIMSQDMVNGVTGQMLAEILGMPCATGVIKINFSNVDFFSIDNYLSIEREMENGFIDRLKIRLPAVLTVQAGINIPRYPCLSNLLAAEQKKIITIYQSEFLSQETGGKEFYLAMEQPEKTRKCRIIKGSLTEMAGQFLDFLRERDFI